MLGLINLSHPPPLSNPISLPLLSSFSSSTPPFLNFTSPCFPLRIPRKPTRFPVFSGTNDNDLSKEGNGSNGGGGDDELKKDRWPIFNIRWGELLLDPDPDNILAVALTGLLTWASVQVLWQLFFISFAILVAAVKYSFVAALLLFILITLL